MIIAYEWIILIIYLRKIKKKTDIKRIKRT